VTNQKHHLASAEPTEELSRFSQGHPDAFGDVFFSATLTIPNSLADDQRSRAGGCADGVVPRRSLDQNSVKMDQTGDVLVGGLEHLDYFSIYIYILGIIIPTDFHIFQRGRYTTNKYFLNGYDDPCDHIFLIPEGDHQLGRDIIGTGF